MRFMKKALGALSRFLRPKTKLFAVKFRRIFKVLCLQGSQKSYGRIFRTYVSENEAVCSQVQTHFGSYLAASFAEKVLGTYSRFLRPKTKQFAVKFRRISEVFPVQAS